MLRHTLFQVLVAVALAVMPFSANAQPDPHPQAPAPDPNAATRAACPMPYTVERTAEVIELQLQVSGLWTENPTGPQPPALQANGRYADYRSQVVGALAQAMNRVSDVHFCRLVRAYPAQAVAIQTARTQFNRWMLKTVLPGTYEDPAAFDAMNAEIDALCADPACSNQTAVLTEAQATAALPAEDFTSRRWTELEVGVQVMGMASASACRAQLQQSAGEASDYVLAGLESIGSMIPKYLSGGQNRIAAITTMQSNGAAAFAEVSRADFNLIHQNAQRRTCFARAAMAAASEVRETAPAVATDAATSAPSENGATTTSPQQAIAPTPPAATPAGTAPENASTTPASNAIAPAAPAPNNTPPADGGTTPAPGAPG